MKPHYYFLLLALCSSTVLAQLDTTAAPSDVDTSALLDIADPVEITERFTQKRSDYTQCVQQVMSRLEPAIAKRYRLDAECRAASDALIAEFPAQSQGFVRESMQRRLNVVLTALERSESTVDEVIADSTDIVDMVEPVFDEPLPGSREGEVGYADEGTGVDNTPDPADIPLPGAEDI